MQVLEAMGQMIITSLLILLLGIGMFLSFCLILYLFELVKIRRSSEKCLSTTRR